MEVTCSKSLSSDHSRSKACATFKSAAARKTEQMKPKIGSLEKAKSKKSDKKAVQMSDNIG